LHQVERGSQLAIATDPARFERALSMPAAAESAAREVRQVYPDDHAVSLFFDWIGKHRLGRKRLLDTMLAATYFAHVSSHCRIMSD